MPASAQSGDEELQLLEDEVIDFGDEPPRPETPPTPPTPTLTDVLQRQQQRPMSSVGTSPQAYADHLRVICSCRRLLRPAPGADAAQRATLRQLLRRAKRLFVDNAASLLVQTANACCGDGEGEKQQLPAFWSQTRSLHECRLWLDLIDTCLFFWGEGEGEDEGEGDGDGDEMAESFLQSALDAVQRLRQEYGDCDDAQLPDADAVRLLADAAKASLQPEHLLEPLKLKKASAAQRRRLLPLQSLLEFAELLPPLPAPAPLPRLQAATRRLNFLHVESALSLHSASASASAADDGRRLRRARRIRRHYAPILAADAADGGRSLDACLVGIGRYVTAVGQLDLLLQRRAVGDSATLGEFLRHRLLRCLRRRARCLRSCELGRSLCPSIRRLLPLLPEDNSEEEKKEQQQEEQQEQQPAAAGDCPTFELLLLPPAPLVTPRIELPTATG